MSEFEQQVRESIERALEEAERARQEIERAEEWIREQTEPIREPIEEQIEEWEEDYHDIGVPAPWEVPEIVAEKVDELRDWLLEEELRTIEDILDDLDLPPPEKDDEEEEEEEEEEDDGWDLLDWLAFGWILDEVLEALEGDHDLYTIDIDFTLYTWEPDPPEDEEEAVIETTRYFFFAPVPFAARLLDPMGHGGIAAPGPGSPNVLIGGLPALRMIDQVACPMQAPIPHTPAVFTPSITDVLINGMPALRAGDFVIEGLGGPNPIVMGCATVIVGKPVPPVECFEHVSKTRRKPNTEQFRWKVEFLNVKGKLHFGANTEGPYARFEGEVELAHLYAESTPHFSEHVKIEAEAILGKVEVKDARVSVPWESIAARRPVPDFTYELGKKKVIEVPPPKVDVDLPWE